MNKLGHVLMVFVVLCGVSFDVAGQDRYQYIEQFQRIAIAEMQRTGIPASIKMAQGILESNAGSSMLAVRANNHFGIKCGGDWRGRAMYKQDDDRNAHGKPVKSCFRWFESPEESFVAHSDFLIDPSKTARYGFLFELDPMDYRGWAYGLKRAGYATNPDYPKLLIRIIEQYQLNDLDVRAMQELADTPKQNPLNPIVKNIVTNIRAYPTEYYNKVETVVAYEGDSPATLSQRLDVSVKKILKYNESVVSPSDHFDAGQRVYLKSKKGSFKGDQKYHVVKPGQSMGDLSDMYGVKLKKLYKRNGLEEGEEPAAGQKIALRGKNRKDVRTRNTESPLPEVMPAKPALSKEPESSSQQAGSDPVIENHPPIQPESEVPVYTVQKSDTLYQIARLHGLTVDQLKKMNNLTGDLIHPGQTLKLQE